VRVNLIAHFIDIFSVFNVCCGACFKVFSGLEHLNAPKEDNKSTPNRQEDPLSISSSVSCTKEPYKP
jgi:hypothetical protein